MIMKKKKICYFVDISSSKGQKIRERKYRDLAKEQEKKIEDMKVMIMLMINKELGTLQNNCKLVTFVEDDPKASFSIATTPKCWGGRNSFSWMASLYP